MMNDIIIIIFWYIIFIVYFIVPTCAMLLCHVGEGHILMVLIILAHVLYSTCSFKIHVVHEVQYMYMYCIYMYVLY